MSADPEFIDFDYQLLSPLLQLLDSQLDALMEKTKRCSDPDGFGLFDLQETICGLGFVILQTYVSSRVGASEIDREKALTLGPRHEKSQRTVVSLINHAANYWKHKDEWRAKELGPRQKKTIGAINNVVHPESKNYPLSGMLYALCSPQSLSLSLLFDVLQEWRREIRS